MTILTVLAFLAAGCEREQREPRSPPPASEAPDQITMSSIAPGASGLQAFNSGIAREYEQNAWHMNQGKIFFRWFNCIGCHANGGGGSGPALMDDKWIYGASIENIAASIREGRPNGMPSWRGKIPEEQIWQIAAYVRSMGRYVPKDAAPSRSDDLFPGSSEQARERAVPRPSTVPPPQ